MAITLRSTSSATLSAAGTSITVNAPAGLAAGDVMYAVVGSNSAGDTIAAPTGWVADQSSNAGPTLYTFYKVATSTEPASYSFTLSASNPLYALIADYTGVNNTTPLNVASVQDGGQNTGSPAFASLTTTVAGCQILQCLTVGDIAADTFTPPTGYVLEVSSAYAYKGQVYLADLNQSAAGATGALTGTLAKGNPCATVTAALNPATSTQSLSGPMTGSATSSASVQLLAILSAMAQGDATASAQIERIMDISATASGRALLSAAITRLERIAAAGSGDATLQATLLLARSIAGAATGKASANAAAMELFSRLSATASGKATAQAALRQLLYLTGLSAGASSMRGTLYNLLGLSGISQSQASATVNMTRLMLMDGSATSQARASGGITLLSYFTGSALAEASATGKVRLEMLLSGAANSSGTAGVGKVSAPVAGAGVGTSSGSGSMDLLARLKAGGVSIGSATGSIYQERLLEAVAASVSLSSGRLYLQAEISAQAIAESRAFGTLALMFHLSGEAIGQAYGSGTPPNLIFTFIPDKRFFVEPQADYFYSEPPASYFFVEPLADYFFSEGCMAQKFSSKNPLATRTATMSAVSNLDAGETLTGILSTTVKLTSGFDPNPSGIISGTPIINSVPVSVDTATGAISIPAEQAVQMVLTGGNDGAQYLITVECSSSNPDKILALTAILPVSIYA